ncbi:MAG: FG-GAP repeat domain-containing protein [Oscillospiraceae bacterium]
MAKKSKIGAILLIGGAAAAAGIAYLKRENIKKLSEEIVSKIRPTEEEGVYAADIDGDGTDDVLLVDTDGDGKVDAVLMDTDGNGVVDAAAIDVDGDGEADIVVTDLEEQEGSDKQAE